MELNCVNSSLLFNGRTMTIKQHLAWGVAHIKHTNLLLLLHFPPSLLLVWLQFVAVISTWADHTHSLYAQKRGTEQKTNCRYCLILQPCLLVILLKMQLISNSKYILKETKRFMFSCSARENVIVLCFVLAASTQTTFPSVCAAQTSKSEHLTAQHN